LKIYSALILAAGLAFAEDKPADAVRAAERSWAAATLAADESTLRLLLADDLTYTHSTGATDTKNVFIENLKTGARKYHKLHHESMDVRVYGDTAILSGTAQVETSQKGGPATVLHLRIIHVWVFENGRWQLAAHQSLRLQD
jgi:ketosteroid isomerase-like protein